jgi:hypothetical protein
MLSREQRDVSMRSESVIFQCRAQITSQSHRHKRLLEPKQRSYFADVPAYLLEEPSNVIDQLMCFAFDTLGVCQLEVRVRASE